MLKAIDSVITCHSNLQTKTNTPGTDRHGEHSQQEPVALIEVRTAIIASAPCLARTWSSIAQFPAAYTSDAPVGPTRGGDRCAYRNRCMNGLSSKDDLMSNQRARRVDANLWLRVFWLSFRLLCTAAFRSRYPMPTTPGNFAWQFASSRRESYSIGQHRPTSGGHGISG